MSEALSAPNLPRPITVLINTHSRQGNESFDLALQSLHDAGIPVGDAHGLKDKSDTERLLKKEVEDGAATVIIGGGDGTLSVCASHLVNTPVAMGVLPLGTGNTLARSLGIPLDLPGAARAIAEGHPEAMDVGRVNGRIFLNSVTLGLSTEIAKSLDHDTKQRLGLLAWPVVGARTLWKHHSLRLRVTAPERRFRVHTHQLVISNGRYIAGPVTAAPDATVKDHVLRVFTLGQADFRSLARGTLQLLLGRHIHTQDSNYFATRSLRVESLRRPIQADIDGEIDECTPLDIEVLPGALRVVVPKGFKADQV